MRVLITGGGTGGHIYPALAIAKGIKARYPQAEILFVGGAKGLEAQLIPREGFSFQAIDAEGLPRKLYRIRKLAKAVWKTCLGGCEAYKILRRFKPTVVVGTGGYVCFSVVMMASFLNIPTIIQEQNALPGRANRILARFASKVAITFPDSAKHFTPRASLEMTGLPVRPEIMKADRSESLVSLGIKGNGFTIVAVGGSQGARTINQAVVELAAQLAGNERYNLIHITGKSGYEQTVSALKKLGIELEKSGNIMIQPYIFDMSPVLAAADFVICRAGATTIAEVTARGIPALLVPYPYAANNHQEYNAQAVVRAGAAVKIPDQQLTGKLLWKEISRIISEKDKLAAMSSAAKKISKSNALDRLVELVSKMSQTKMN